MRAIPTLKDANNAHTRGLVTKTPQHLTCVAKTLSETCRDNSRTSREMKASLETVWLPPNRRRGVYKIRARLQARFRPRSSLANRIIYSVHCRRVEPQGKRLACSSNSHDLIGAGCMPRTRCRGKPDGSTEANGERRCNRRCGRQFTKHAASNSSMCEPTAWLREAWMELLMASNSAMALP